MGKIGTALQTVQVEGTPLQREVGRLVRRVSVLGLSLCALVVVLYGLVRGGWLEGFLAGITLAMAVLPEEFPVVLTVFLALGLLQGGSVLLIVLAVFLVALYGWHDELDARAVCFTTLVVANLGLIFANRSWSRTILATLRTPNPALWWVFGGTLFFLGLVLYVPFLRDLFHFSTLHPDDLALCLASGLVSVLWFEGLKLVRRQQKAPHAEATAGGSG
jgi:magnesium-transporting ATPase (P-type)